VKNIIVTGDTRGLGHAICKLLLQKNVYRVIGIGRSETAEIKQLTAEFRDRFIHIPYSLADIEGIRSLYLEKLKVLGPIHGLVNNAATAYDDILTNLDQQRLDEMYRVNVFAPMHLTKFAIRDMVLNHIKGSIVFISSLSTTTGYKGLAMYASTKGALEAFATCAAREWGAKGIRVNSVAPGFMETQMSQGLSDEQKARIYKRTSLQQATDPVSVAHTVEFLLSDASSSLTGETIRVDAGAL
jgi:3-oxoacyl-[acyl-carrier protein] reductase